MLLNNTYSRDDFLNFLEDSFLTDFKKDIRPANTQGFSSIQKAYSLGRSESLDLQVFEFSFEGSPNKRVTLTKDAFQVMRSSAIFRALAIFHSPDSDDWRLSLMTAIPERTIKGKASLSYSNPKRLSFFLGPNATTNTPYTFLYKKGQVTDFGDLQKRFSVEVVNEEFYKQIALLFTKLIGGQRKIGSKYQSFVPILKLPSHSPSDNHQLYAEFAVRLIGRIVFCWFLKQKKSSDMVPLVSDSLLGTSAIHKEQNYYHSILEPLFFEVLNKRKDDDNRRQDLPDGSESVPYLNGGLFEQHIFDYYSGHPNFALIIPNDWFHELFGILELYNFTIDENTSVDIDLSIDPEMLGRIFENLLAEINPETGASARKSTGSYYTPRAIVDYMVQTSLKEFLQSKFPPSRREYLDENDFLKLCKLNNKDLLYFIQHHFHKTLLLKSDYFIDEGFTNIVVSPRIIAKLRGLDTFGRSESMHRHALVNQELWQAFLSDKVQIVDKLFGKIKKIKLKKQYPWVTVCMVFKYEEKLFAAFFSPLLTKDLSLTTIYTIDEKRYDTLKKRHQQIDLQTIFNIKKKSSRRDADLPHTGTNPVAAQRFSTLQELLSDSSLLDEELRVKLGARDAVLQEVEQILAGSLEKETEEYTKQKIVDALDSLKVLDPACGSGAFPMGILQKVVEILQEVDPNNELYLEKIIQSNPPELRTRVRESLSRQNWDYARKLGIIRKSIYGVDIQPIATEISRLRVFLSLVVDQNIDDSLPNRGIEVLPNLDFKFVTANSLIGLPKIDESQQSMFDDYDKIDELKEIRDQYFNAHGIDREKLKFEFSEKQNEMISELIEKHDYTALTKADLTSKLTNWKPFKHKVAEWFDPEWMFGVKDGFDIVIANPPYSLVGSNLPDQKAYYKKNYSFISYKINTYVLFIEKGLSLLKNPNSNLSYIIPKSLVFNTNYHRIRELLLKNYSIHQIVEIQDEIFESAQTGHSILLFSGKNSNSLQNTLKYQIVDDILKWKIIEEYNNLQSRLLETTNYNFYQSRYDITKVRVPYNLLSEIAIISNGLNPGNVRHLLLSNTKVTTNHQEMILGKDIQRYKLSWSGTWVNYDRSLKNKFTISDIKSKKGMTAQQRVDFALRNVNIYFPEKILVRKTSDRIISTYDKHGYYFDSLSYGVRLKNENKKFLLFILALLNSKLINYIHEKISLNKGKVFAKILGKNLAQIPIIKIDHSNITYANIVAVVDQILTITKSPQYDPKNPSFEEKKLEKQIDQMVYKLYELTEEEIKIVEGSIQ
jgi:hypothetical protein